MGFDILKKIWHFLWKEDSWSSWVVSMLVLVIFVKFIFYPVLGIAFGTGFPVVAVLSGSMEHNIFFEEWWSHNSKWYEEKEITKDDFRDYNFHNGFNQGDIIILFGVKPEKIEIGDVIVYDSSEEKYPIIHRVTDIDENGKGYKFQTKGDNNFRKPDSPYVEEKHVLGRAYLRLPLLGWVKIWATDIFNAVKGGFIK